MGKSPGDLINHGEDEDSFGGFFISSGKEKIIRMLIATRSNFPICVKREGFKSARADFTEYAVEMVTTNSYHLSSVSLDGKITTGK